MTKTKNGKMMISRKKTGEKRKMTSFDEDEEWEDDDTQDDWSEDDDEEY